MRDQDGWSLSKKAPIRFSGEATAGNGSMVALYTKVEGVGVREVVELTEFSLGFAPILPWRECEGS